jgi:hypothetical protein
MIHRSLYTGHVPAVKFTAAMNLLHTKYCLPIRQTPDIPRHTFPDITDIREPDGEGGENDAILDGEKERGTRQGGTCGYPAAGQASPGGG